MHVIPFLEYLTEHDASHELGVILASVCAQRETIEVARGRGNDACLVGASPTAA